MSNYDNKETDIDLLRNLLLGEEKNKIEVLEQHFDDPEKRIQDVSSVLPQAVKLSICQDDKLNNELIPVVEDAIKASVKRDIHVFADALYPVMGPAIRKSISETFKHMIQSMNKVLEHSFSWRGIKWRFEAWKMGKSFAEVVLLHSLIYQVEQVFLIHKETGLLLHHTSLAEIVQQDTDLISSMLTAIQDFVHDSFNDSLNEKDDKTKKTKNDSEHSLNQISLGEFSIWIEQGPDAVIAVVVKGTAPKKLRQKLILTLENIHHQHAKAMQNFSGDDTEFSIVDEQLQGCLLSQFQPENNKISWAIWGILFGGILGVIFWLFIYFQEVQHWQKYVQIIQSEPGLVITDISEDTGQYVIQGLRDPLAREPEKILTESSLTQPVILGPLTFNILTQEQIVHRFEPYQSLTEGFIEKRAVQLLKAPDTVEISVKNGVLRVSGQSSLRWKRQLKSQTAYLPGLNQLDIGQLEVAVDLPRLNAPEEVRLHYDDGLLNVSGSAPDSWIQSIETNALSMTNVEKVNLDKLVNLDKVHLKQLERDLETESIFYEVGKTLIANISSDETIIRIISKIKSLIKQSEQLSIPIKIIVQGFSDPVGPYNVRLNISYLRAENIRQFLIDNDIDGSLLDAQSMINNNKIYADLNEYNMSLKRRVSFSVDIQNDEKRN